MLEDVTPVRRVSGLRAPPPSSPPPVPCSLSGLLMPPLPAGASSPCGHKEIPRVCSERQPLL